MKSIQIDEELHKKLKEFSEKSGMKIRTITEQAIDWYLRHVHVGVE